MKLREIAQQGNLNQKIHGYLDEMLHQLGAFVAIPSLPVSRNEDGILTSPEIIRMLHYALSLSQQLGFRVHNENDNYGWAEVGESGPLVCIFTHLDIVPVGEGWTREPFQMTEEEGWLYGRGILDNKGPAIACLYALKACCDLGVTWPCRVRIWFGTNEERGMNDVQLYIRDYGAPDYAFVPDSQFPLSYSELGTTTFQIQKAYHPEAAHGQHLRLVRLSATEHTNCTPIAAEAILEADTKEQAMLLTEQAEAFAKESGAVLTAQQNGSQVTLTITGKPSYHWNEPWTTVNPLSQLTLFLSKLDLGQEPNTLIRFTAQKVGLETDGTSLGIAAQTETASLSVATSNVQVDDHGMAYTFFMIAPAELRIEILINAILRQLGDDGLAFILESMGPGFLLDKEDPLVKTLYESYCHVTGTRDPIKVCGGTYGKFIPNAVPFGAIFTDAKDICHVPDEHIEKSDLTNWAKIYADALLRICDDLCHA